MKKTAIAVAFFLVAGSVWGVKYVDFEVVDINLSPIQTVIDNAPIDGDTVKQNILNGINEQLGILEDQINNDINKAIPDLTQSGVMTNFANASVNTLGLGVDYTTNVRYFIVGGGLGLGFSSSDSPFNFDSLSNLDDVNKIPGAAVASSGFAGLNLNVLKQMNLVKDYKYFKWDRASAYLNFARAGRQIESDDADIDLGYYSLGAHLKYRAIKSREVPLFLGMLRWNGIDLVSGFDVNHFKAIATIPLEDDLFTVTNQDFNSGLNDGTSSGFFGPNEYYNTTGSGDIDVGISVTTFSIPVEAVTSVRLFYVLSSYIGLGFDLNLGGAKTISTLSTDIQAEAFGEVNETGSGAPYTPQKYGDVTVESSADFGQNGRPYIADLRLIHGYTFNMGPAHLYIAGTANLAYSGYGARFGASVGW